MHDILSDKLRENLKSIFDNIEINFDGDIDHHKNCIQNGKYVYQGTEEVEFIDKAIAGAKPHTIVHWCDGTDTFAIQQDEGVYDYELGMLICVAKKLCHGINIDEIYDVTKDVDAVKNILKQMIKATSGNETINDIKFLIKDYKQSKAYEAMLERRREKNHQKALKRKEKIERLKKEGKWVSAFDLAKVQQENIELKERMKSRTMAEEYKRLVAENEQMKKELEGRTGFFK